MTGEAKLVAYRYTRTPQRTLIAGIFGEKASERILIYIVFSVTARCAHVETAVTQQIPVYFRVQEPYFLHLIAVTAPPTQAAVQLDTPVAIYPPFHAERGE